MKWMVKINAGYRRMAWMPIEAENIAEAGTKAVQLAIVQYGPGWIIESIEKVHA